MSSKKKPAKTEHVPPGQAKKAFVQNLTQKICLECGERAIRIDKDRFGKRHCACGNTWYPQKKKKGST